MGSRVFGHVGDEGQEEIAKAVAAAPNFTQDEVDYLKKTIRVDLAGTAQTQDEMVAVSHNCAKAEGILMVINHMQAIIDARKPK